MAAGTRFVTIDDPGLGWEGAVSVEHTGEHARPWRLPYEELALFPSERLREKAAEPAGVRLVFRTGSTSVSLVGTADPDAAPIDCCCDGELAGSARLDGRATFEGLPDGDKVVELWLPQRGRVAIAGIELDERADASRVADARPRWITYGSSITHCRTAPSPTAAWPAIVARRDDLHLTCLGFGGECHLDPMIARLIRDLPADVISLCVGINIYGQASFDVRTLRPALLGFVATVRDDHADIPLIVISPIWSPSRERELNPAGMTLEDVRAEVAAAVDTLRERGDDAISYVDGRDLLGPDAEDRLPDGLHPDAAGYRMIADAFRPLRRT